MIRMWGIFGLGGQVMYYSRYCVFRWGGKSREIPFDGHPTNFNNCCQEKLFIIKVPGSRFLLTTAFVKE